MASGLPFETEGRTGRKDPRYRIQGGALFYRHNTLAKSLIYKIRLLKP